MAWEQLTSMLQEARDIDAKDASTPPKSCPNDGHPLRGGPEGKLFCPADGMVWPDDAGVWGEFPGSW